MSIALIILFFMIILAFFYDIRMKKIPNYLTLTGMLAGAILHFIQNGFQGMLFSIQGLGIGAGVFLLLYLFGGIGAGDVKLFGAIGALSGVKFVLYCAMYSILLAGWIALIILLSRRNILREWSSALRVYRIYFFSSLLYRTNVSGKHHRKEKKKLKIPFMWAVLPGYLITYYELFIM